MIAIDALAAAPAAALARFESLAAADAEAFAAALARQAAGEAIDAAVEAGASRHLLRQQPIDGPRWLRLWTLMEAECDTETQRALLRAALADGRQDPAWQGAVARLLVMRGDPVRGATGRLIASLAVADHPDEGTLSGTISACAPRRQGAISCKLLAERPGSPVLAYHAARRLFDAGQRERAIATLRRLGGLEEAEPYTARLLIDMLVHAGDWPQAREVVTRHLARGPSTIWSRGDIHPRRLAARARGVPPILISTQPKSGSVFMLNTLSEGLDCPFTYTQPPEHRGAFGPYAARMAEIAGGGIISVDHIVATPHALDALVEAGLRRLVVHLRDPRAATLSWCHNLVDAPYQSLPRHERLLRRLRRTPATYERDYLDWLPRWCEFQEDWLRIIEEGHPGLTIMRTDFEDMGDEQRFFDRLLHFFDCPTDLFDASVLAKSRESRAGHFRKGLKREWEDVLSTATQVASAGIIARYPRVAAYVAEIDRHTPQQR